MSTQEESRHLYFRLLGAPRVFLGSEELTAFRTAKNQALLFFLAVAGGAQRRATLADLLWQDVGEDQANTSLRGTLYNLRQLLPGHLAITRHTVALHQQSTQSDIAQFDRLLKRTGDPEADIIQAQVAVSLYAGDFLEGFHVANAPQFELWATLERTRLRDAMVNALLMLVSWHTEALDFPSALDHLNRLLGLDPASEVGHRHKMKVLDAMGRRSAALSQFEICKSALQEGLGVLPAPETTALYELILAGRFGDANVRVMAGAEHVVEAAPQSLATPAPAPARSLPVDFGEMPRRMAFFGRQQDLAQLIRWLTRERCSLVVVEGMGGIGKTTLATEAFAGIARLMAPGLDDWSMADGYPALSAAATSEKKQAVDSAPFDWMVWRSLVNAPTLSELVGDLLETILEQPSESLPGNLNDRLSLLFRELDRRRCLVVLDNVESILAEGVRTGHYRAGYEDYGQLIERSARGRHRSCFLLTTRELPRGIRRLSEDVPAVRTLSLAGLHADSGAELFQARGVRASDAAIGALVRRYSGNPLALKLVADTVRDLFGGQVESFLSDDALVFDDIRNVLDQQFGRLGDLEREIVVWLAVEREPVSVETLWRDLARAPKRSDFLDAVQSLRRGSLVEETFAVREDEHLRLGLPNVIMEYVTDRLRDAVESEIVAGQPDWLHRYAMLKAHSKEYIQQSQRRMLLEPAARQLEARWGTAGAVQRLHHLAGRLRDGDTGMASYAGATVLHLLLQLKADLRGADFSRLALWQADLRKASLIGVDLRRTDLKGCTFLDTFGVLKTVAISPDGQTLAAGGSDTGVFTWRMADFQPQHVLGEHQHSVGGIAFSPDGAMLASAGYDGAVYLWDAATGQLLDTVHRHSDTASAVCFSPDGAWLASGGADRQITLWNCRQRLVHARLPEQAWINGLAFSPDGRILASATDTHTVNLWNWRAGQVERSLPGHEDKVHAIAFSPDGAAIASGGEDGRILVRNLADPDNYRVLADSQGWILSLAFSSDGSCLAAASTERLVRLWDMPEGRLRRLLHGHTGWASAVAFSPDGEVVASAGYDQTVHLWHSQTGMALHTLRGHVRRIDFVRFSADGRLLASSSLGGSVHLWDVEGKRLLHELSGQTGAVRALSISPDNKMLAGGCDDHQVYVWETASGQLRQVLAGHGDVVRSLSFSANGRYLISGSHDGSVRVWETATGQLHLAASNVAVSFGTDLATTPDGQHLAFGSTAHSVTLLELGSGDRLAELPMTGETLIAVAFDERGRMLACGSNTGALWLWDISQTPDGVQPALRFALRLSDHAVWRAAFGADSRYCLCATSDETVHIVDVEAGNVCYTTASGPGAFSTAILKTDPEVITAGPHDTLVVSDLVTGRVRLELHGHSAPVTCIEASQDGRLLASSSADGTVRLWDVRTGDCHAVLEPLLPYAGMNIAGATGITPAQRATLLALGAVETYVT